MYSDLIRIAHTHKCNYVMLAGRVRWRRRHGAMASSCICMLMLALSAVQRIRVHVRVIKWPWNVW
jgi:hypothetical protein